MKYPYFRFSKRCETAEELQSWFDHFEQREIACAIVETDKGFYLWRGGKEAVASRSVAPNRELIDGSIIKKFDPDNIFADI